MNQKGYNISVDLDVFKTLTSRIEADGQDHNHVLRNLLNLDSPTEIEVPASSMEIIADTMSKPFNSRGFYSRGLLLPEGTELRARFKGKQYAAKIVGTKWISEEGVEQSSPSAAASAVTGTTVNGWRFWEGRLPNHSIWRRLDILQSALSK